MENIIFECVSNRKTDYEKIWIVTQEINCFICWNATCESSFEFVSVFHNRDRAINYCYELCKEDGEIGKEVMAKENSFK